MRLRISLALLLLWAAAAGPAPAQQAEPTPELTPERVQAAVDAVRADPLLGGTRSERRLRWKDDEEEKPTPAEPAPGWLIGLVRWLAESGRLLVWLLGAIAVALLVVLLRRWILVRAEGISGKALVLPSHVRDLDIRPESLPGDIAAAARGLWQRGEQRGCLSLLYRGALSRLVHGHAVPIRAASTEGECVQLAARVLPGDASGFFERLVQAWLVAVYGARSPDESLVLSLCDDFDRRLPARAEASAGNVARAAGTAA